MAGEITKDKNYCLERVNEHLDKHLEKANKDMPNNHAETHD